MKADRLSYLILAIVFFYLLWINFQMPLMADDYRYAQNWQQTHHLKSWSEIGEFQLKHYWEWGGRSIAHTLAQCMLFIGKPIFNVLNSGVFILFIFLLYCHIEGSLSKKIQPLRLLGLLFLIWFCIPTFGETSIWLLGSCNYLWMLTLILIFLLPYRLAVEHAFSLNKSTVNLNSLMLFLLGILAGWTNENNGLMMLLYASLANLYLWKKGNLRPWMIWGLVGAIIGYILLFIAPGNYARLESAQIENYSFVQNHIIDPLKTMSTLFLHQLPIYFTAVALIRRIFTFKKNSTPTDWKLWLANNKNILQLSAAYVVLSYSALFVMFASPTFPQRAGLGAVAFLVVGVLILLRLDICQQFILFRRSRVTAAFIIGMWIFSAVLSAQAYHTLHIEHEDRMAYIASAKAAGIKNIRVHPFSVKDRSAFGLVIVNDIGTDPEKFRSVYYAKYFGFETMARINTDETMKE